MKAVVRFIQTYPAACSAVVQAAVMLAVAFGWHLTDKELAGISTLVAAVLALFVHTQVTPTLKSRALPPPTQNR